MPRLCKCKTAVSLQKFWEKLQLKSGMENQRDQLPRPIPSVTLQCTDIVKPYRSLEMKNQLSTPMQSTIIRESQWGTGGTLDGVFDGGNWSLLCVFPQRAIKRLHLYFYGKYLNPQFLSPRIRLHCLKAFLRLFLWRVHHWLPNALFMGNNMFTVNLLLRSRSLHSSWHWKTTLKHPL